MRKPTGAGLTADAKLLLSTASGCCFATQAMAGSVSAESARSYGRIG